MRFGTPLKSQYIPMFLRLGEGQAPLMSFHMSEVLTFGTTETRQMSQVSRRLITETTDPPLESQCIPIFLRLGEDQAPLMSFQVSGSSETTQKNRQI